MGKTIKKTEQTGGMKILARARTFKLNTNESIIDGNTVAMPFVAEYAGQRVTYISYEWKDSDGIKRGLNMSGHGKLGVPTLREKELFIALQRIFIRKKTKDGICELKIQDVTDDDLGIDFTITELGRELGYKSMSNLQRNKIKEGIQILVATTVFNEYAGGIYDVVNKKYIDDKGMAFHYIESIVEKKNKNDDLEDVTQIKLSRFVYDTLAHSYNVFYNIKKVEGTSNLIAKNIYRLALQWKGKNDYAYATIQTLIDRTPMGLRDYKSKKQQIKKALKVLDENNMLKIEYDKDNKDLVYMKFQESEICVSEEKDENNLLKKFNTYKEVKGGLLEVGYTEEEVENFDVEDLRYIKALLRFYNINKMYKNIVNPKKYFDKCYKERYVLEEKYFDKK